MILETVERTETLTLRLSIEEKSRLEEVSRRVDRKPSQYMRWLLVKELGQTDTDAQHRLSRDGAH